MFPLRGAQFCGLRQTHRIVHPPLTNQSIALPAPSGPPPPLPMPANHRSVFGFCNFAFSRMSLNGLTRDVAFEVEPLSQQNGLMIHCRFCVNSELVPFLLFGNTPLNGVIILCLSPPQPKHTGWFLSRSTCSCWASQMPSDSRRAAQVMW